MAKPAKTDRQKVIDDIRKKQKGADRRRGFLIVGVCITVAVLIVGAAAYRPVADAWAQRSFADQTLDEIGADPSVCGDVTTESAEGSGEHVPDGTTVTYETSPPAFGDHWNSGDTEFLAPVGMSRKFYSDGDRPRLEQLVHNLEHGFTVVWYDETIADDTSAVTELEAVARKFPGTENLRYRFIAAPWTSDDGEPFPDDQHIAMTHWSIGGAANAGAPQPEGVWQYCSEFSGEALEQFMIDYPYLDSPEPNAISPVDPVPTTE